MSLYLITDTVIDMNDTTEINSRPYLHGVVHIHGDRANCNECGDEMTVDEQHAYPVYDGDSKNFICNVCFHDAYGVRATALERA